MKNTKAAWRGGHKRTGYSLGTCVRWAYWGTGREGEQAQLFGFVWWHIRSFTIDLSSSTPPVSQSLLTWGTSGSVPKASLQAIPPTQRMTIEPPDSHYFPSPTNKGQCFSLSQPPPLHAGRVFMLYKWIWKWKQEMLRKEKSPSRYHSMRIFFSCALPLANIPMYLMSYKV